MFSWQAFAASAPSTPPEKLSCAASRPGTAVQQSRCVAWPVANSASPSSLTARQASADRKRRHHGSSLREDDRCARCNTGELALRTGAASESKAAEIRLPFRHSVIASIQFSSGLSYAFLLRPSRERLAFRRRQLAVGRLCRRRAEGARSPGPLQHSGVQKTAATRRPPLLVDL